MLSRNTLMASASAVVKIAVDGRSLIYRSVVGQTVGVAHDVAVDSQGRAWVVGHKVTGGGFISKISPDGSTLVFAVDFGQGISSYNVATRIALDAVDRAYICGVWSQLPVTADALISNPPDGTRTVRSP